MFLVEKIHIKSLSLSGHSTVLRPQLEMSHTRLRKGPTASSFASRLQLKVIDVHSDNP